MKKKTCLQIGPYNSIGGVSIHIKRLVELLKDDYHFEFIDESPLNESSDRIFNLRSKNFIGYIKLIKKADLIHIHSGIWWLRCFHIFWSYLFKKKQLLLFIR